MYIYITIPTAAYSSTIMLSDTCCMMSLIVAGHALKYIYAVTCIKEDGKRID